MHFVIVQNVVLYILFQSVTFITTVKRKITMYNAVMHYLHSTYMYLLYVALT